MLKTGLPGREVHNWNLIVSSCDFFSTARKRLELVGFFFFFNYKKIIFPGVKTFWLKTKPSTLSPCSCVSDPTKAGRLQPNAWDMGWGRLFQRCSMHVTGVLREALVMRKEVIQVILDCWHLSPKWTVSLCRSEPSKGAVTSLAFPWPWNHVVSLASAVWMGLVPFEFSIFNSSH